MSAADDILKAAEKVKAEGKSKPRVAVTRSTSR